MARPRKLTESEIQSALESLAGWRLKEGKLHREYTFTDFAHAFGFMAAAAVMAEGLNHHPEWCNVWNRVSIDLTTHDAGGITELDVQLAAKMEEIAGRFA